MEAQPGRDDLDVTGHSRKDRTVRVSLDEAAERWKRGVEAAAPFTEERRKRQAAMAVASRKRGAEHRCSIKGCERHAYKGPLCRKHWDMVPVRSKVELTVACYRAQIETAARLHKRYARELQRTLNAAGSPSR